MRRSRSRWTRIRTSSLGCRRSWGRVSTESRSPNRKTALATSQVLTSRRRANLANAAQDQGFTLVQIHDGASFADLLYRDSAWSLELLGLTGAPPPLSVMPLPTRPVAVDTLVGRSDDLVWLTETPGDLLLVGQPGSGKTFLLREFARANGALFVRTTSLSEIANGVREEDPTALIVEDAHVRPDFLPELRRLREEVGAGFRILADSWPGSEAAVVRAMDIPSGAVRHLELMSKDEMAELVRHTGISSPLGLIQEIVNQAEGRPGLGAMLCQLCLRGDVAALATGDALASEVATVYGELVGEDVTPFLAAFSVAGDAGLTMQVVADYMDLPIHVLRERVSKLAAGGVLVEVDRERLAVRPPALRHALVRDVFFSGPTALQIEPLLAVQPSLDAAAETILGARHRGAQISDTLLRGLVERTGSRLAWLLYAQLGRREAEWIAAQHPERLLDTSTAVLDVAPDLVIPVLLEAAVGDHRRLNSSPDHPLRQLGDWVTAARPGSPSVVERRGQLRSAAAQWLEDDGDVEVGAHALALSLSPEFSRTDSEPGSGRAFVLSRGFITLEDARALRLEWRPYATA